MPLLRRLAAHPQIERLKAFFYTDTGLVSRPDAFHGTAAKWDMPLLDGYQSEILHDWRLHKARSDGYLNPAVVSRLLAERWDSVMITSYLYPSDWLACAAAKMKRIGVLFYGEMYPRASAGSARGRLKALPKKLILGDGTACLAIGSLGAQVYRDLGVSSERVFLAPYAVDNEFFMTQADLW